MAVVGGGDTAEGKCNNQIEAMMAVVGTVDGAIDGREARAKGKMRGWQAMQGNWVAEDATGGGGGQHKVIGRQRTQQEEGGRQCKVIKQPRMQWEGRADDTRRLGGG